MKGFMIARAFLIQPSEINLGNFLSRLFRTFELMACIVLSPEPRQALGVDLLVMVCLTDMQAGRVPHPIANIDILSIKCPICFKFLIVWVFNCLSSFAGGEESLPWPKSRFPPTWVFFWPPWHTSLHFRFLDV